MNFVYPNPATWLRGFEDAEFVITDSFHGTVFLILHNVPFVTIGKKSRGLSKFESLLKMLRFEGRFMIDDSSVNIDDLMNKKRTLEFLEINMKI